MALPYTLTLHYFGSGGMLPMSFRTAPINRSAKPETAPTPATGGLARELSAQ